MISISKNLLLTITLSTLMMSLELAKSAPVLLQGIDYDSAADWKDNASQPDGSWHYGLASGNWQTFTKFTSTTQANATIGGSGLHWGSEPAVGQFSMKPADDARAVRRWVSPISGTIEIDYDLMRLGDAADSISLLADIQHNGTSLWSQQFAPSAPLYSNRLSFTVQQGDSVDFSLDAQSSQSPGWTHFRVKIQAKNLRPNAQANSLFHWPFDDSDSLPTGSGNNRSTTAVDLSQNNRHGTMLMGADSRIPGRIGNCLNFNGGSDYLVVDPQNSGDGASALTFSAWIHPVIQGGFRGIITSSGPTYNGLNSTGYVENGIEFRTLSENLQSPPNVVPFGAWTHVAGVWRSGQVKKLFINGEVVAEDVGSITSGTVNIDDWIVGRDRYIGGRFFNGRIDDPAVWTRDLSDAEIKELYQLGLNGWNASYLGNFPTTNAQSNLTYTDGLTLWLDAQNIDGQSNRSLTDAGSLGSWLNKAGGKAGDAQASPSAVIAGRFASGVAPNRLDAVRITASEEAGIQLSEFMDSPTFSIFAVARATGGQGNRPLFWDGGSNSSAEVVFGTTAAGCWVTDSNNRRVTRSFSSPLFDGAWDKALMILSQDSGNFTLEAGPFDSVQSITDTAYVPTTWEGSTLSPELTLTSDDSNQRFDGEIAEILIYDHALSTQQRALVLAYIENKYFRHKGGFLLKIR